MISPVPSMLVKTLNSPRSQHVYHMYVSSFESCYILLWFLFQAVDGGNKDVIELLVRNGAEVNGTHSLSGWSCLHQAVYKVTT